MKNIHAPPWAAPFVHTSIPFRKCPVLLMKRKSEVFSMFSMLHVCREFPGELEKVMVWFRDYKIPDGKPANAYGYDSKCMNAEFTKGVIEECSGFYNALKSGDRKNDVEVSLE
jgi:hypothetical protein